MDRYVALWRANANAAAPVTTISHTPPFPAHSSASASARCSSPASSLSPPKTLYLIRHGESTHNAQFYAELGADPNDPRYLDAPLTPRGAAQAAALVHLVYRVAPQLVVCSPLTRAIDTCLRATALLPTPPTSSTSAATTAASTTATINTHATLSRPLRLGASSLPRLVVRKECAERLAFACDIGSPVPILEQRFPHLDFSHIRPREAWWWTPSHLIEKSPRSSLALLRANPPGSKAAAEPQQHVARRITAFRRWLVDQPESKIMIFGHGAFLRAMMAAQGPRSSPVPHFENCEIRTIRL